MPGSPSWILYVLQGVKGFDELRDGGEGSEGAHSTNYRGLAVRRGFGAQHVFVLLGNIIIFFNTKYIPYRRRPSHSANYSQSFR